MNLQGNKTIAYNRKAGRKRKRRGQKLRILCYIILTGFCCFCLWRLEAGRDRSLEKPTQSHKAIFSLDSLSSKYAVLMDGETGEVLEEKNGREKIYPASMTKLMAALVAVEHTENWDAVIDIPQEIFARLYMEHASLAGFEPGEKVSPEDLLYGMLLPSGAECCTVYAMWLAGGEEAFVEWMNEKAAELGMVNTHFVNTTGLHDSEHYSTVEDMAVLMYQCLKNETLRSVLQSENYQTDPTTQHPLGLTFESTLFQAITESRSLTKNLAEASRDGVTLLGGKTGYTSQAGLCLASFARIGDREYILVTAKAKGDHYTEPYHIKDALAVYSEFAKVLQH